VFSKKSYINHFSITSIDKHAQFLIIMFTRFVANN